MVFVSILISEKNQLQIGKKWKKIQKNFFITLFAKKNQSEKISLSLLALNVAYISLVKQTKP